METQKQHRNDKLQKSSLLFLQLGLVLALFLTYTLLEFESVKTNIFAEDVPTEVTIDVVPDIPIVIFERIDKPIEKQPQAKSIETIEIVPDHKPTPKEVLEPIDSEEPSITDQINDLPDDPTVDTDEPQPFILVEDAPIFPGCEGLNKQDSKQCFTNGITKFVNRKFNTDIADNLSGKQKIWVQFVIDKTGTVTDIKAKSPSKQLEKEAIRVVEKLPQMTPGKQRKRAVPVKYTLPIVFQTY